jgi:hypothetical protein
MFLAAALLILSSNEHTINDQNPLPNLIQMLDSFMLPLNFPGRNKLAILTPFSQPVLRLPKRTSAPSVYTQRHFGRFF